MTPASTKVRVEPAIPAWSLNAAPRPDRTALVERINARARRLGTATLDPPASRLIATGHQAQLWHPGILAKDLAMGVAAERLGAQRLHMVVDQDANEAWRLEVPWVDGEELKVKAMSLAGQQPGVPTGFQPPAEVRLLRERLAGLDSPLTGVLDEALDGLPTCETLAEQVAVVLACLKQPYAGDVPVMMVSDLAGLAVYESVVSRMLDDAHRCASLYNKAVAKFPRAGMPPMVVGRELAELPLWAVAWRVPRRRVFADLADSAPMFVYDDGEPIDRGAVTLLPRALLLTAVMRGYLCDLFIHGTGGLIYDRVTEAWWGAWACETLAPMAGVTADVFLDLGVPLADRASLDRAVWRRHHLPHNLDRELGLDGEAVQRKRDLLKHMDDDRGQNRGRIRGRARGRTRGRTPGRARRRAAFEQIKKINLELAEQHPDTLASAERDLHLAQVGMSNARAARRRDWCFALYPPGKLHGLRKTLAGDPVAPGGVQSQA
jgi:hypothetical protein